MCTSIVRVLLPDLYKINVIINEQVLPQRLEVPILTLFKCIFVCFYKIEFKILFKKENVNCFVRRKYKWKCFLFILIYSGSGEVIKVV